MPDTVRFATSDEVPEIIALANKVFRPHGNGCMGREYPVMLSRENAANLYIVLRDGKIVSHVGVQPFVMRIEGVDVPSASIGSVCTDPDCRKQGLAWQALDLAIAEARRRGDVLMPISGGRSLYRRHDAGTFGPHHGATVELDRLGPPEGRPAEEADIGRIVALHEALPVRYRWDERLYRVLIAGQAEVNGKTWVHVDASGQADAFAVVRAKGFKNRDPAKALLTDFAGPLNLVAGACAAAMRASDCRSLEVSLPWHRLPAVRYFTGLSDKATVGRAGNTLKVLNLAKLVELFADRLGPLKPLVSDGALELALPDGPARLTEPLHIHHVLFTQCGFWPEDLALSRDIGQAVSPNLPLPIPDYGINYI